MDIFQFNQKVIHSPNVMHGDNKKIIIKIVTISVQVQTRNAQCTQKPGETAAFETNPATASAAKEEE